MAMMVLPLIVVDRASGDPADVTDTCRLIKCQTHFYNQELHQFDDKKQLNLPINLNRPK